eukprot:jgi/Galph1/3777/GphlegSOOS_G2393.1
MQYFCCSDRKDVSAKVEKRTKDTLNGFGSNSPEKEQITSLRIDNLKQNVSRSLALAVVLAAIGSLLQHSWVAEHQELALSLIFFASYVGIISEELLLLNKTAVALVASVILWSTYSTTCGGDSVHHVIESLSSQLSSISEVIFFLMGAMTIVEVVDAHDGFQILTRWIKRPGIRSFLWMSGFITFFLSSVLDNLTSSIVMLSLFRKVNLSNEERRLFGASVVVAANAGGAWTPIGDVTTTMLWIQGHISSLSTLRELFLPSIVTLIVSLSIYTFTLEADKKVSFSISEDITVEEKKRGQLVLFTGIGSLLFVPILKALTGLPPYMHMLAGLGCMWLLTDILHAGESQENDSKNFHNRKNDREHLKTASALNRIDVANVLFFLGILLSVACLDSAGVLKNWASHISEHVSSVQLVPIMIGLVSSLIDNVPIVAATMGMYDSVAFPKDSVLWQLIALCAGTGGSIFIIGSAAGVAFMGLEKVDFFWYLKKASFGALAGYFAGVLTYLAFQNNSLILSWLHLPSFFTP